MERPAPDGWIQVFLTTGDIKKFNFDYNFSHTDTPIGKSVTIDGYRHFWPWHNISYILIKLNSDEYLSRMEEYRAYRKLTRDSQPHFTLHPDGSMDSNFPENEGKLT